MDHTPTADGADTPRVIVVEVAPEITPELGIVTYQHEEYPARRYGGTVYRNTEHDGSGDWVETLNLPFTAAYRPLGHVVDERHARPSSLQWIPPQTMPLRPVTDGWSGDQGWSAGGRLVRLGYLLDVLQLPAPTMIGAHTAEERSGYLRLQLGRGDGGRDGLVALASWCDYITSALGREPDLTLSSPDDGPWVSVSSGLVDLGDGMRLELGVTLCAPAAVPACPADMPTTVATLRRLMDPWPQRAASTTETLGPDVDVEQDVDDAAAEVDDDGAELLAEARDVA